MPSNPKKTRKAKKKTKKLVTKSKVKKPKKSFFNELVGELFLFLEVKKLDYQINMKYSLSPKDPWYLDIKELIYIYQTFKRFYLKKNAQHVVLNFIIMAIVIIFYKQYFDRFVFVAARSIVLRFRTKLHSCSEKNLEDFYLSVRDSIQDILEAKGKFVSLTILFYIVIVLYIFPNLSKCAVVSGLCIIKGCFQTEEFPDLLFV